ncbi:MAG TPA: glycosyltransferase family 9 protein [Fusobacterium sp.]|uniref:glycosyltransferase family 9 protein n=1 Tax=Fusobacterium sp. TaxID=68766 RepID=UPI002F422C6C
MKMLIIHTAFIGDIVLSTPMIAKIVEKYPGAEIYYLTVPAGVSILKNNPHITKIISYDKKGKDRTLGAFFRLVGELRKENFDKIYCPHRYLRSMLLTLLIGAREKIGYKTAPLSCFFEKKIEYCKDIHEVKRLLTFVEGEDSQKYEIALYPGEPEELVWKTWKREIERQGYSCLVALAPGSRWETKRWPVEYFQEVLDRLSETENIAVLLLGGKEERRLSFQLRKGVWDLRGKTSLLGLAKVLQEVNYVVTNDSSPIHIASSSPKAKIIAIFGPTVKEIGFTPWSDNSVVIELKNLACRPCSIHGTNICPQKHFRCMKELKPELILQEIQEYSEEEA